MASERSNSPEQTDSVAQRLDESEKKEDQDLKGEEEEVEKQEEEKRDTETESQSADKEASDNSQEDAPPLPDEALPPPLPDEAPPSEVQDDGWQPLWDENAQAYYFYNRFTGVSQWENPRVPDAQSTSAGRGLGNHERIGGEEQSTEEQQDDEEEEEAQARPYGGYNPAIHGDYDPTAPYAKVYEPAEEESAAGYGAHPAADPSDAYVSTGTFNRFTGKWQDQNLTPDRFSDANKSYRQMSAYFDVDAAANSHDGRSLRAERAQKKLSKKELKEFKEKRRQRKEEKRRAWLLD
ncbi:hypothetical protein L228DRAFT_284983 [Xylona heveae TC161]|uniref:WW domain-containing protein n=1 Tax=Xylona heveae (strain CBS 132557 / TC161) TaxID=1328760 RepID=A0A165ACM3_XYLHT|nr:hypothetical protein L228DRAFT_284983 [Xylona heveae TC161]KZF20257.1 hypothetical protein L228DRAFT_284983 [Xylona heveae TC161]